MLETSNSQMIPEIKRDDDKNHLNKEVKSANENNIDNVFKNENTTNNFNNFNNYQIIIQRDNNSESIANKQTPIKFPKLNHELNKTKCTITPNNEKPLNYDSNFIKIISKQNDPVVEQSDEYSELILKIGTILFFTHEFIFENKTNAEAFTLNAMDDNDYIENNKDKTIKKLLFLSFILRLNRNLMVY